jgi:hypothetical protein
VVILSRPDDRDWAAVLLRQPSGHVAKGLRHGVSVTGRWLDGFSIRAPACEHRSTCRSAALESSRLATRAGMLSTQTWQHVVQRSPCLAERPPPGVVVGTPWLAGETRTRCQGRAKVSNELSNYRGANRQPRLDNPGSFRAPGIGIDAHLGCFTPKRSLVRTQYRPPASSLAKHRFRLNR